MLSKKEALYKAQNMMYSSVGNVKVVPLKDVNKLIREIYSIRPYRIKELKPDMWVYDTENEDCRQIARINKYGGIFWHGALCEYEADKFKEGRFFPVIKAMYQ